MAINKSMNTFAATLAIGLLLVAGILGIVRLEIGQPTRETLNENEAFEVAKCLPQRLLPISTDGAIWYIDNHRTPKKECSTEDGEIQKPPMMLKIITTGWVEVVLPMPPDAKEKQIVPIGGQTLRLTKGSGDYEFYLRERENQQVDFEHTLLQWQGRTMTLDQPARFGPTTSGVYLVKAPDGAKAEVRDSKLKIPPGTDLGQLEICTPQSISTLQPLLVRHYLFGTPASLSPLRTTGQPGIANLSIEARRSGVDLQNNNAALVACAQAPQGSDWKRVAAVVNQEKTGVEIALPESLLPKGFEGLRHVRLVVASADGWSAAIGGVKLMGRVRAGLLSLALTAALLIIIMWGRARQFEPINNKRPWVTGLFIGEDMNPSLSLFQMFFWTLITIWGYFYVFIVAGNLLSLTTEVMGLLGIAGVGSVLARWTAIAGQNRLMSVTGSTTRPHAQKGSRFWTMLNTNGEFDLLKLQLFVFTIVIGLYVLCRIADAAAFPKLDENTLLLLGVSQGVYLTGKLVGTGVASTLKTLRSEIRSLEDRRSKLQVAKQDCETKKANASTDEGRKAEDAKISDLELQLKLVETQLKELLAQQEKILSQL